MVRKIKLKISPRILKKKTKKTFVNSSKRCRFCNERESKANIDYKNTALLKGFLTDCGKILPARISGNCASCQKRVSEQIKISRIMALIPFCSHY